MKQNVTADDRQLTGRVTSRAMMIVRRGPSHKANATEWAALPDRICVSVDGPSLNSDLLRDRYLREFSIDIGMSRRGLSVSRCSSSEVRVVPVPVAARGSDP